MWHEIKFGDCWLNSERKAVKIEVLLDIFEKKWKREESHRVEKEMRRVEKKWNGREQSRVEKEQLRIETIRKGEETN